MLRAIKLHIPYLDNNIYNCNRYEFHNLIDNNDPEFPEQDLIHLNRSLRIEGLSCLEDYKLSKHLYFIDGSKYIVYPKDESNNVYDLLLIKNNSNKINNGRVIYPIQEEDRFNLDDTYNSDSSSDTVKNINDSKSTIKVNKPLNAQSSDLSVLSVGTANSSSVNTDAGQVNVDSDINNINTKDNTSNGVFKKVFGIFKRIFKTK